MQFSKSEIRNPVRMGLLLEFNSAFPDEQPLSIDEYLSGGSREMILNVVTFLLGFKNHKSKYADNRELLKMFFGAENNALANQLYDKIKVLETTGNKVGIINTFSSLTLFEHFFKRPAAEQTQSNAEFEVNFFKAYLVLNTHYTSIQENAWIYR